MNRLWNRTSRTADSAGESQTSTGSGRSIRGRLPSALHVLSMTWRDGAFFHWPVDPDVLRPEIPSSLTLDTYDGTAWLSVLPFVLTRAGLRGSPSITRRTVAELNVRTYVQYRDRAGLYFFSIDVDDAVLAAIVGSLTRIPCYDAKMSVSSSDDRVAFSSSREPGAHSPARFAATYEPDGEVFHAEPGSLAHWLTNRRRFYDPTGPGVLTAEIAHAPWPLCPATVTIQENTMFAVNDLPEPDGDPIAHFCGELAMTGSLPTIV